MWETVLKTAERSRRMRMLMCPELAARRSSFVILMRAMIGSKAGLERCIEFMVRHVLMDLGGLCSFQDLAQETKVGHRPVVIEIVGVDTGLLEGWSDGGHFETGGNNTRLKRGVSDGDQGHKQRVE